MKYRLYSPCFYLSALAALTLLPPLCQADDTPMIDPVAVWNHDCKKCHDADGSGQTKMGQRFGVQDYRDPAVQAKFSDEEIVEVIKTGVTEGGKKKMPPYGEKLTDAEIEALVQVIRGFAK